MEFEHNNLQCKPNLVFRKSVYEDDRMYRYFRVRDPFPEKFDRAPSVHFLTPFPSVKIDGKKKQICQGMRIAFFCEDGNIVKQLMLFYVPFVLIGTLNVVHVMSRSLTDTPADYIENASTIALASAFLLPIMYSNNSSYRFRLGINEVGILLMFIAFIISTAITPFSFDSKILFFWNNTNTAMKTEVSSMSNDYELDLSYFLPVCILSFAFILMGCFNWSIYYRNKRRICKANGDYDGLSGFNVSDDEFNNKQHRRLTVFHECSSSGKIRKRVTNASKGNTMNKNKNPGPFRDYICCNGWSAGFRVNDLIDAYEFPKYGHEKKYK